MCHQWCHPPGRLARACEREPGGFTIWQCDRVTIIGGQHATGVHHGRALRASRPRRYPAHTASIALRAIQSGLLSHLTARGVRELLTHHRAARQIPGAAVNQTGPQHAADHAGTQRSRRHALTSQRRGVLTGWQYPWPACIHLPGRTGEIRGAA